MNEESSILRSDINLKFLSIGSQIMGIFLKAAFVIAILLNANNHYYKKSVRTQKYGIPK